MLEDSKDLNASTSFPYGLVISCILVYMLVDLSGFKPIENSTTHDTRTFSCIDYTLVGDQWHKKNSVKARSESVKAMKISIDSASLLLKDMEDVTTRLLEIENTMEALKESIRKILQLHKDTNTCVGKFHLVVDGLKQEGVSTKNKLIHQVDFLEE